ncbi:aminopeptidase N-like isoform X2 [Lineus longissimus]|uniref:aminopeptidase N-like isoform X2 n=1 Tax=Lineus longissimus TaxID=88925 RepID=UPI002B4D155B
MSAGQRNNTGWCELLDRGEYQRRSEDGLKQKMTENCNRNDGLAAEKRPINANADGKQDGGVYIRAPRRPGYFIQRTHLVIALVVIVILIILVGLLSGLLNSRECENQNVVTSFDNQTISPTPIPQKPGSPQIDPALPWGKVRLPSNITPSYYIIELRVDLEKFIFLGNVTITLNITGNTQYIIVHQADLKIDDASVIVLEKVGFYSHALEVEESFHVPTHQFYVVKVKQELQVGKIYTIQIGKYQGDIRYDILRGIYRSSYTTPNGTVRYLLASQLQAIDARRVFPGFDEPEMKSIFAVTIIHKPEYTALSNMPAIRNRTLADGWVRTDFADTPRMSTYILAFVVSDFIYREGRTKQGLPIRIWSQPDMYSQSVYALRVATKCYEYFTGYFQIDEVVPKSDQVAVPDFGAGAMENWGLIIYRQTALLFDQDTSAASSQYFVTLVIAHEVAHTWFGNMATMKWWDDLWLNEGFASTLMYFAMNDIFPDWKVFDMQLTDSIFMVMTKDSLPTSHPISTPIKDPDDIAQFFDSISYDKGLAVLRLLRGFLGWENFRLGLQTYIRRYKFGNAEMAQLWAAFSEVSHVTPDVTTVMDTWTRQMGLPLVTVTRIGNDRVLLKQERFLLNPDEKFDPSDSPYGYKWYIPFHYQTQDSSRVKLEWMNMDKAEIYLPGDAWIIGNYNYMGFYRVTYEHELWLRLIVQLKTDHKKLTQANRAGLIGDAFNLARAYRLSYAVALNVSSYLSKEEDFVPWKTAISSINWIESMLSRSEVYGLLQTYIRNLVAPAFRRAGVSGPMPTSLPQRKLRSLILDAACRVAVPDAIKYARDAFTAWMKNGSYIIPDYAFIVYSTGIKYGGQKEWDFLWEKAQSTKVVSEKETMMNALGYTREPWLLWRFAGWMLDRTVTRLQDVRLMTAVLGRTSLSRMVLYNFLLTKWKVLNDMFSNDNFVLRSVIGYSTSKLNTEYELQQVNKLFKETPPDGKAQNEADNAIALLKANIKWMKNNYDTIAIWLKENVKEETKGT